MILKIILQQYLPIILYLIFHFALIEIITKKSKMTFAVLLILCLITYTNYLYLNAGKQWNKNNVLSLLPTAYIIIAILLRYAIFNKFNHRFFKEKESPFDPVIIYPGVFTIHWSKRNYSPYNIEYIYSFSILILPWCVFMVI